MVTYRVCPIKFFTNGKLFNAYLLLQNRLTFHLLSRYCFNNQRRCMKSTKVNEMCSQIINTKYRIVQLDHHFV